MSKLIVTSEHNFGHVMAPCIDADTGKQCHVAVGVYVNYATESFRNIVLWYNPETNTLENSEGITLLNPFDWITPTQLKEFRESGKPATTFTLVTKQHTDFVFIRTLDGTYLYDVDWWDGGDVTIKTKGVSGKHPQVKVYAGDEGDVTIIEF